jgi:F0F1-type ATP synthase membrane subunit b/b'
MKYSMKALAAVMLIAAFVLSGCDSRTDRMEEAEISAVESNRDLEIANSEMDAELQIFRIKHDGLIKENNRSIGQIKERIKNEADMEVRVRHEQKLAELEKENRDLKREIDNYKASEKEDWNDFKVSFNDKMDDLGESLKNFFSTGSTTTSSGN